MLYEPFPGGAAVVLTKLGLLREGQAEGLGVRTFDAESGRLSLAMDDGRVIELVRASHARIENRYAVLVRTDGLAEDRGFIQIDKDFGVTDLLNHKVVYPETAHEEHVFEDAAEGVSAVADDVADDETMRIHAVKRPVETATEVEEPAEVEADEMVAEDVEPVAELETPAEVEETKAEEWDWATEPASEAKIAWEEPTVEVVSGFEAEVEIANVSVVEAEALAEVETPVEDEAPGVSAEEDAEEARKRYYRPLLEAFEPDVVAMFGWVAETGTIQTYEHRVTGRYMHIDGASGLFYDQRRTPISGAAALRHVMPVVETVKADVVEEAAPEMAEASAVLATRQSVRVNDAVPQGDELGLDTFVRKHQDGDVREGWRKRIAGLGRTFRLGKNVGGREE